MVWHMHTHALDGASPIQFRVFSDSISLNFLTCSFTTDFPFHTEWVVMTNTVWFVVTMG